jgi:predicted enzyme related to lactoylglutathione lyase
MKATVSHYEIPASDPERAAHFYRQVFGWRVEPLAWERPYFKIRGSAVPSELGKEGIDGGIAEAGGGLEHPLLIIHIEDADLQSVLEKITAAGGSVDLPVTRVGTMGWWARFRDSEGNLLGLWQAG